MTAAVLFALYAAAAGMLAPAVLRGPWAVRSPRLAMTLWLVLPVSWVAAIMLAILAATAPAALTWTQAPRGGSRVLLAGQAVPGGRAIAIAGLLLVAVVVLRAAGCAACELHRGQRDQREHAALVAATGRPGDEPDIAILDYDAPAIYCLPCGKRQIVISAGALAALTPEQLRAVLAHERAHLRHHHHIILAPGLPGCGGFAATSLDDIAVQAGITRVILYRHFDSKTELYQAVLDRMCARLEAHVEEPVGGFTDASIDGLIEAAAESPAGFRLLSLANRFFGVGCSHVLCQVGWGDSQR